MSLIVPLDLLVNVASLLITQHIKIKLTCQKTTENIILWLGEWKEFDRALESSFVWNFTKTLHCLSILS